MIEEALEVARLASERDDEDWSTLGAQINEKVPREIRKWADE